MALRSPSVPAVFCRMVDPAIPTCRALQVELLLRLLLPVVRRRLNVTVRSSVLKIGHRQILR